MRHRSSVLLRLFVLAVLPVALACGDDGTEPEPLDPSGVWSGTSQGFTVNLTLNLGAGGNVSGSGSIAGSGLTTAVVVSNGTFTEPNLSVVLAMQDFEDVNLSGRMETSDLISASLNGSGFDDFTLNLRRQ